MPLSVESALQLVEGDLALDLHRRRGSTPGWRGARPRAAQLAGGDAALRAGLLRAHEDLSYALAAHVAQAF